MRKALTKRDTIKTIINSLSDAVILLDQHKEEKPYKNNDREEDLNSNLFNLKFCNEKIDQLFGVNLSKAKPPEGEVYPN